MLKKIFKLTTIYILIYNNSLVQKCIDGYSLDRALASNFYWIPEDKIINKRGPDKKMFLSNLYDKLITQSH